MNIKSIILILVSALALTISCNTQSTTQQLNEAHLRVYEDSAALRGQFDQATNNYEVTFEVGDLPGDVEGETKIELDHAHIIIDVNKVNRHQDCLEAVIGHEMYHVVDARIKYGVESFIAIVGKEKNISWESRTVEKSAIVQEDRLRGELIATGRYNGIARTREAQNARRR